MPAAILLLAVAQCAHHRQKTVSTLSVADADAERQLLGGFYNLEDNRWRWTARKFAVSLATPPSAEARGAKLVLKFYIPVSQIESLGPLTLQAELNGSPLAAQTYSQAGEQFYTRDVRGESLRTNLVPVLFSFDKASRPDGRELGAVVMGVGLQSN